MIRLATPEDHDAVSAIVQRAYKPYIPRLGREPGPMLNDYASLIEARRVHVLADEPVVKGVLVLIQEGASMLLDNIAIDPSAQGSGYGRQLLEFAEQSARSAGCKTIRLYTNEAMTENVGLYHRIGYRETHRAKENGFRRVYMEKPLA